MLVSDFGPPITAVLNRLPDTRVQQYWDPEHVLAKQMAADARPPQPEQACCVRSGILWDLAAVYPAGATWDGRLPPATIFNGPVVDVADAVAAALSSGSSSGAAGTGFITPVLLLLEFRMAKLGVGAWNDELH